MAVIIRRVALLSALEGAKNLYPNEFIALLREEGGVITEILLAPFSEYGPTFSSFQDFHLPPDPSIVGTFHSHPSPSNRPSRGDLQFFSRKGKIHLIAGIPFGIGDVKAYDNKGAETGIEVID